MPGGRSEHGSLLSGNLCPSRVNSQCKSTAEALEALLHFLPSHFLHLGDAGNAGKRIDRYGSLLHGVALRLGLNTPSLRLEESNANLTPNFYIDRDIPLVGQ